MIEQLEVVNIHSGIIDLIDIDSNLYRLTRSTSARLSFTHDYSDFCDCGRLYRGGEILAGHGTSARTRVVASGCLD
jgi:hypothetical protein